MDLDDLACIVLANLDIALPTDALNMVAQQGIAMLGCGRSFMPSSTMLPFAQNSRYPEIVGKQLGITPPFQKQLRRRAIQRGIANQGEVLRIANRSGYERLLACEPGTKTE